MERSIQKATRKPRTKGAIMLAAALLVVPLFAGSALARDHDDRHDRRQRIEHRNDRHDRGRARPDVRSDRRDHRGHHDVRHRDHDRHRHQGYRGHAPSRHHDHHKHRDRDRDRGHLSIRIGTSSHSHVCEYGHYATRTHTVLVSPERHERVWVEPVYATRYDSCGTPYRVLIREGHWKTLHIPAQYETRTERYWVAGACDHGCSHSSTHISGGIKIRF